MYVNKFLVQHKNVDQPKIFLDMAKLKLFYLVDFGTGINGQNCVLALFFLEFGIRIVIQLKSENKWLKLVMVV